MRFIGLTNMLIIFAIVFSHSSFALVDYSQDDNFSGRFQENLNNSSSKRSRVNSTTRSIKRSSNKPNIGVSFNLNYDTLGFNKNVNFASKIYKYDFGLELKTNYDIFFKMNYSHASVISQNKISSSQTGNPSMILGFNWMKFGESYNFGMLNIFGGAELGQKNSSIAHSATDQIYGVETFKRFYSMALVLGYELRITGKSQDPQEQNIGNIQSLYASVGMKISYDIKFAVDFASVNISGTGIKNNLDNPGQWISYSYFSPKISLNLSQNIAMDLVSIFTLDQANVQNVIDSKRLGLLGSSGNMLRLSLIVNI